MVGSRGDRTMADGPTEDGEGVCVLRAAGGFPADELYRMAGRIE